MNILMIAFEAGRWGQARLVQPLHEAAFNLAALCPDHIPLAKSSFLQRLYPLTNTVSSRQIEKTLAMAMNDWQPDLIIPGDERAVACLQKLVLRGRPGRLGARNMAVIAEALGKQEHYNAMLMKSDTIALARSLGILVPQSATVADPAAATSAAAKIGFPVFVKKSFSWAGLGVVRCETTSEVSAALRDAQKSRKLPFHRFLKRITSRDWYPTVSVIDVQQAISGTPAFYCGVAIKGRIVAGFAGVVQQTISATGPSSIVEILHHDAMSKAARLMAATMGLTGFVGFDFMIETATGLAYLLECNPRPIPACHLGAHIGVNLCEALRAGLQDVAWSSSVAAAAKLVAFFPQEWLRDAASLNKFPGIIDVPHRDPGLLKLISEECPGSANFMPTLNQYTSKNVSTFGAQGTLSALQSI